MSDFKIELSKLANLCLHSSSKDESMKHLIKAFLLFSNQYNRLERANKRLIERVNKINFQLIKTDSQLIKKQNETLSFERYFYNMLQNSNLGILFVNSSFKIEFCNDKALKILDLEKDAIENKSFFEVFQDNFFGFSMKKAISFKQNTRDTYINILKKDIRVKSSFDFEDGLVKGLFIYLEDISQTIKLQNQDNLQKRLIDIGSWTSTILHDIKNPLSSIRGFSSLLLEDLKDDSSLKEMVLTILDSSKTIERLASLVLEYAKPISLKLEKVNINEVIYQIIKSMKVDFSISNKIKINLLLFQEDLDIYADISLLKLAFFNIIKNALESLEDKGSLDISAYKNLDLVNIEISDTGMGIEKKDLENIFCPFFTTKKNGNGLGLANSYKIIKEHMGNISAVSIPYKKTTFTICLPLKRE